MSFKIYHFFTTYIIYCSIYNPVISNPMIGQHVKLAIQGQYLSVVSLKRLNFMNDRKPEEDHVCTGVLVSRRDVMTAAHCQEEFRGYVCEVKIGNVDITKGRSFYVEWWLSYARWAEIREKQPEYEDNDVAIARLSECVSNGIPIPLRGSIPNSRYFGQVVTAAGFGINKQNKPSRFMQIVDLYVLSTETCEGKIQQLRGQKYDIYQSLICAAANPFAILMAGNSGAPIFYRKRLVGIYKGFHLNHPDYNDIRRVNIFFSVYYFREFIDDVIENC